MEPAEVKIWIEVFTPVIDRLFGVLYVLFTFWLMSRVPWRAFFDSSSRHSSMAGKALLYAIPLFLAPCIEKTADILLNDQWPTKPRMAMCLMLGLSSACIGLRAFFDGSYERERTKTVVES